MPFANRCAVLFSAEQDVCSTSLFHASACLAAIIRLHSGGTASFGSVRVALNRINCFRSALKVVLSTAPTTPSFSAKRIAQAGAQIEVLRRPRFSERGSCLPVVLKR